MGCCKCEEHSWPDPQDVVWQDEDGEEYCIFHAPAEYKKTTPEHFNNKIFNVVDAATNSGSCNLDGTIFFGNISFEKYDFRHPLPFISFRNTEFLGDVNFTNVVFGSGTNFFKSIFHKKATFSWSKFSKDVRLNWINFKSIALFEWTTFNGKLECWGSRFNGKVSFKRASFTNKFYFYNTHFNSECSFIQTSFGGTARFEHCTTKNLFSFRELQSIKEFHFANVNLSNADFLNTSLSSIHFRNVTWKTNKYNRYHLLVEDDPAVFGINKNDYLFSECPRLTAVSDFYRQMKKRCRDEQNDAEASLWHYAEKEVQLKLHRLEKRFSFQHIMLEIYRFISRYGEDPWQATEVLLYLLIILFGILALGGFHHLNGLGIPDTNPPFDITADRVGKLFRAFAQYALFIKPDWSPPVFFDVTALFLSRLLIPIQAAILAFAIRNKLHR